MVQFIANNPSDALAALAAGAQWIHYTDPSSLDNILAAAQQARAIVTIPGAKDLQKDTRVHGVILAPGDMPASQAREFLGPHAVIGCMTGSLFEIINLASVDVDFFILDAPIEEFAQIVNMAREKGVEQRISALSSNPEYLEKGADALFCNDINLI